MLTEHTIKKKTGFYLESQIKKTEQALELFHMTEV